eukprot:Rmarinus@m.3738
MTKTAVLQPMSEEPSPSSKESRALAEYSLRTFATCRIRRRRQKKSGDGQGLYRHLRESVHGNDPPCNTPEPNPTSRFRTYGLKHSRSTSAHVGGSSSDLHHRNDAPSRSVPNHRGSYHLKTSVSAKNRGLSADMSLSVAGQNARKITATAGTIRQSTYVESNSVSPPGLGSGKTGMGFENAESVVQAPPRNAYSVPPPMTYPVSPDEPNVGANDASASAWVSDSMPPTFSHDHNFASHGRQLPQPDVPLARPKGGSLAPDRITGAKHRLRRNVPFAGTQ